ncbi:DNA cytosine methyltransferase [Mycoplasma sp. 4423]
MEFKFIDLFAGIGGFRIALENVGAKCVFSSEIDKYASDTYQNNFGEFPAGDIFKINSNDIPEHQILCAGFPCQPFSTAGKRLGFDDDRGILFFQIARILRDKQPISFILENVPGLVNHDNGNTLKVILETLNELGYNVSWKLLNAKDYNIPQNRNRWYCVGIHKSINIDTFDSIFPNKQKLKNTLKDIIETKNTKKT